MGVRRSRKQIAHAWVDAGVNGQLWEDRGLEVNSFDMGRYDMG